jgi:hypothetical protein
MFSIEPGNREGPPGSLTGSPRDIVVIGAALVQIGVTSKNAPRLRHGELKHQARRSRPQVQLGPEGPDVPI